jgi:hypothetical protein
MGPLSQTHTTLVRATGDKTHRPFLVYRKCNLGKHKFCYLPDFPCSLDGQRLVVQTKGTAALKLRGPEAKIQILTVVQEEEWQLCASKKDY